MIPEKMLELLVINTLISDPYLDDLWITYDRNKVLDRLDDLIDEFLKPYVIAEKSE